MEKRRKSVKRVKTIFMPLLFAVLLTITMMFDSISVSASGGVKAKLDSVLQNYPVGSTWTSSWGGATQCFGFARMIFSKVYGCEMPSAYKSSAKYEYSTNTNVTKVYQLTGSNVTAENLKAMFANGKCGDIIQGCGSSYGQHTMILYSVTSTGITIYDCNSGGNCEIKYQTKTWSKLASRYSSSSSYPNNGITLYRANNYNSIDGTADNVMPTIQNVKVVARYKNGFTMQCVVTDNTGVSKVQFPTWESSKTSAGCTWYEGTNIGNNTWQFTFPNGTSQGWYMTHIYAWDTAGNSAVKGVETYVDRTAPQISNVSIVEANADGYKVRCTVTDNYEIDRVQFPTWTGYNGQDDIQLNWTTDIGARGVNCGNNIYEYYVKRSDHNSEFGQYATHIYAYDTAGNRTSCEAGIINLENVAPTVTDVKIVSQTDKEYTVTCKVVDDQSGVARVQFPTWTKEGWQDDLTSNWTSNSKVSGKHLGNGVYSYTVKRSEHNNEYGKYYTDIYAFDALGNMRYGGGVVVEFLTNTPSNPTTPSTPSTPSAPSDIKPVPPAVGTVMNYKGLRYKIMKNGSGAYMQCIGPVSKYITEATIYGSLRITNKTGSFDYPITQVKNSAFKNCKKLKKIQIGSQIKTIGKYAFYNCKKLKSITIKSKQISKINKNAFKGIYKKAKIIVPASKRSKYKKMIRKAGAKSTVKFK